MNGKNIVLYSVAEGHDRRPLISCDPDDKAAGSKIRHAISSEFHRGERAGVGHPEMTCVLEEREANESGTVTLSGKFTPLNLDTLQPDGESVSNLEALFPKKTPPTGNAREDAIRAEEQSKISSMIAVAVEAALAAQKKAIENLGANTALPAVTRRVKKEPGAK